MEATTKKTKLQATLPDGTIVTRTTARTYTHIVAVREDLHGTANRKKENAEYSLKEAARYDAIADYLEANPELQTGDEFVPHDALPAELRKLLGPPGNYSRTDVLWTAAKWRGYAESSRQSAERYTSAAQELLAGPDLGPWGALCWCGRLDLAQKQWDKASDKWGMVKIVEVAS